MADEITESNTNILREQKLTTNALASVIVEVRKQNSNERNSLNKLQSVKDVIGNLTDREIQANEEKLAQEQAIADAESKREETRANRQAMVDRTFFDTFEEIGKGFGKLSQSLAPVKDAVTSDLQKLLGPISLGLSAIPGFETVMAVIKLILSKSLGFIGKNTKNAYELAKKQAIEDKKFRRQQAAKARREGRAAAGVEGEGGADFDGPFAGILKILKGAAVAILIPIVAIASFVSTVWLETAKGITTLTKLLKTKFIQTFPNAIKSLGGFFKSIGAFFTSKLPKTVGAVSKTAGFIGGKISGFFNVIRNAFGRIMKFLSPGIKAVSNFIRGSRILSGVSIVFKMLGRIFYPIQLLISTIKGLFQGVKDAKAQEGGIVSKIFAGAVGFFKGFFSFLVGGLLDAIKGAFSFILDKIGLDSAADFLRSFNFTDLIGKAFDGIKNAIFKVVDFIKNFVPALFAGFSAAAKNLFTSPVSSFKEAFNARFNQGGGADAATGGADTSTDITNTAGDTGTTIGEGTAANETERSGISRRDRDSRGNLINTVVNNSNVNNSNNFTPENTSTSDQAYSAAGD